MDQYDTAGQEKKPGRKNENQIKAVIKVSMAFDWKSNSVSTCKKATHDSLCKRFWETHRRRLENVFCGWRTEIKLTDKAEVYGQLMWTAFKYVVLIIEQNIANSLIILRDITT